MLAWGRGRWAVSYIQFSSEIVETKGVLYCLVVSNRLVTLTLSCMCDFCNCVSFILLAAAELTILRVAYCRYCLEFLASWTAGLSWRNGLQSSEFFKELMLILVKVRVTTRL